MNDKHKEVQFVFGSHLIGEKAESEAKRFGQLLESTGRYPGFSAWSQNVEQATAGLKPGILTIDGNSFHPTYDRERSGFNPLDWRWKSKTSLFGIPGNPFDLRTKNPLWIVEGDLPFGGLIQYRLHIDALKSGEDSRFYPSLMEGLSETAIRANEIVNDAALSVIENDNKMPIYHTNKAVMDDEEQSMAQRGVKIFTGEWITTKALFLASTTFLLHRAGRRGVSRREFIGWGTLAAVAGINSLRTSLLGSLAIADNASPRPIFERDQVREWGYSWYGKPLTGHIFGGFDVPFILLNDNRELTLRNAITAIKALDAESVAEGKEAPPGFVVDVMGSAHRFGGRVGSDMALRERVVYDYTYQILSSVKGSNGSEIDTNTALRSAVLDQMNQLLGGFAVWEIGDAPSTYTPEEIARRINLLSAGVSPTISRIVNESAETVKI